MSPTEVARRTGRLNIRIEPALDAALREAAALEHKTVSAFVVEAASERAHRVVEDHRRVTLSVAEFNRVMDELDRPGRVVEPLLRLAERAKQTKALT